MRRESHETDYHSDEEDKTKTDPQADHPAKYSGNSPDDFCDSVSAKRYFHRTETAIKSGCVRIVEDRQLNSASEMDPSMHGPDVDFEPTRQVVLESTAGGERAQLIIVVGKRSFLWYDAAWNLSYPAYS